MSLYFDRVNFLWNTLTVSENKVLLQGERFHKRHRKYDEYNQKSQDEKTS